MSDVIKKIRPLNDNLLLIGVSDIDTSVSGIIIPESSSKDRPSRAKVLAVGPGKLMKDGTRRPMEVKVGDIVLYSQYAPREVKLDGQEYFIASEDSILAIVD